MTALAKLTAPSATTAEIALGGVACALDLSGALYMLDEATLVVADLHLEKGSSLARRGSLLPPYDTRTTLLALGGVIARYAPRRVVALGDSFHDVGGPERLGDGDAEALAALQAGREWVWIVGNHDPSLPEAIGGDVVEALAVGDLTLRHAPEADAACELAGHLHPVGKVVRRGGGVRRRCFVTDGRRCVMPAFGAYAGGLNVCDPVFRPLFPDGFTAHVIGGERLFAIGRAMLCAD
jgi:DNA ligase-associated metallophosphoesterase